LPTETATVSPELPKREVHPDNVPSKASAWRCKRCLILMTKQKEARVAKGIKGEDFVLVGRAEQVKQTTTRLSCKSPH